MQLRRSKRTVEVSTSSLNDIMFFLLLFFLIIAARTSESLIDLSLPKSQKPPETITMERVTLEVTADLQYYVNGVLTELGGLETALAQELEHSREQTVVLKCDKSLTLQDLVDVLQIGDALKVKMILATSPVTSG
jgi:biopolymer transport protein ExbD